MKNQYECRICGNTSDNSEFIIKEMMFGFRDEFKYFQCSNCGCLQIGKVPSNMEKYYPTDYYSFSDPSKSMTINDILKRSRDKYVMTHKGFIGRLVDEITPSSIHSLLANTQISKTDKIIDIGCGGGGGIIYFKRIWF